MLSHKPESLSLDGRILLFTGRRECSGALAALACMPEAPRGRHVMVRWTLCAKLAHCEPTAVFLLLYFRGHHVVEVDTKHEVPLQPRIRRSSTSSSSSSKTLCACCVCTCGLLSFPSRLQTAADSSKTEQNDNSAENLASSTSW